MKCIPGRPVARNVVWRGFNRMEAPKAPTGVGSGEEAVPPPQKNLCIFSFEMVHFDAFWRTFKPTVIVTMSL